MLIDFIFDLIQKYELREKLDGYSLGIYEYLQQYKDRHLNYWYFKIGKNALKLIRSQDFLDMIIEIETKQEDEYVLTLSEEDARSLYLILFYADKIVTVESWDINSVFDSAIHKVCTRCKITRTEEMKRAIRFVKNSFPYMAIKKVK